MAFTLVAEPLSGLCLLRTDRYDDSRGFFEELYRHDALRALGINAPIVQLNHSRSHRNVVRGLHYQLDPAMGKLLTVIRGKIRVAEVDVRRESTTYGQVAHVWMEEGDGHVLWIPPGFANGFAVHTDVADVLYGCTEAYNPAGERAINPLDPTLRIDWGIDAPILSDKDRGAPLWSI
ncbi:MAG: dTDP-4-dehydrorhamnose 3,5-epimerase [Candidatus Kapabacteria bacterium]|jgi:dTDP-4-dehydrorhamnose 3,5-epimerase|nr:dTDP-4-dehydrorhamnose 3,5-epimerase [Candidatus Kapabacteria bacterium]